MILLYLFTGFIVGMGLSVQTSMNGRLRKAVGSPFLTSLISFFISTIFIAFIILFQTGFSWFSLDLVTDNPAWMCLGGFFGCIFLTGNILLFPRLGAVQTVIFPVLGQIIAGLIIDQFGLFHAPVLPMGGSKIAGTLFVLAGVLGVVYFSQRDPHKTSHSSETPLWFWRLLGICTGACSTLQITINGQLGLYLNSAVHAALISFIVGTLSLFLMVCAQRPKWQIIGPESGKNPWWMWLGGLLGAFYVIGNAWISPRIGTGTAVVIGLLGLMSAGLLIDQTGMLQSQKKPVRWQQVVSLGVMFSGVCVIRMMGS